MEKLLNEFTVHRPIDEAWAVLTDLERIAPCMPGAQLQEIEGETYRGVVKVKLGAISTAFKGEAHFVERDDVNHKATLHGEGRDTTGKGNADALITATMTSIDATSTTCVVETDLRITGKVAQFGRGIMGDVSKKLIAQFATNLNTMLDESGDAPAPAAPAAAAADATDVPAGADAAVPSTDATPVSNPASTPASNPASNPATASSPAPEARTQSAAATGASGASGGGNPAGPTVRKIEGPANEPIELSGLAGSAVLKRLLPGVIGLVLALLVLRRFRK